MAEAAAPQQEQQELTISSENKRKRTPKQPKEPKEKKDPIVVKVVTIEPKAEGDNQLSFTIYRGQNGAYFVYGKVKEEGGKARKNYLSSKQIEKHGLEPRPEQPPRKKRKVEADSTDAATQTLDQ